MVLGFNSISYEIMKYSDLDARYSHAYLLSLEQISSYEGLVVLGMTE